MGCGRWQCQKLSTHTPPICPYRRKENLAARATTKLENKKAKREKKLLRAGFEGRKTGFINAKTT